MGREESIRSDSCRRIAQHLCLIKSLRGTKEEKMKVNTITVDEISEKLSNVDKEINHAIQAVEGDMRASPVLRAIVEEFQEKSKKTLSSLGNGDEESISEHIIELEEAGDCAKKAALADVGLSQSTRSIVLKAHDIICDLKSQILD
jgi:hypothetical protein